MTQDEAGELLSGKAFDDPNTLKNDPVQFENVREILKSYKIENLEARYGENREDWRPYPKSDKSIGKIIQEACNKINYIKERSIKHSRNKYDDLPRNDEFMQVEPEFVSSIYFNNEEFQDQLGSSGAVLIMDDLSFFHPPLREKLNKIISNKRAAIIMLSTLSGSSRDQAFYDLIDEALKIRLKEAHERYYNSLDPKCEIWVDDLSIFERWLSKVLPEEARFVGMTQPHPESQKVLQSLFADECTTTGRKVLGYVSRSVNRGSIQG